MNILKSIATTSAIAVLGFSAFGAPKAEASAVTYPVSSAVSDASLADSNSDHAFWLPFFRSLSGTGLEGNANAADFDFVWDGSLELNEYGEGWLKGTIRSQVDSDYAFDVVFDFAALDGPGADGPKLELLNSAYASNGGPIDPNFWNFFELTTGTLTGVDSLSGLNFDVSGRGAPFQIGEGANGKNGNLGASVWFSLATSASCTSNLCADVASLNLDGDVNVDLTPVPVPAAFLLFGTGLAGFGAMRRKKSAQ